MEKLRTLVAEIINGSPGGHNSTESGDQLVKALQAIYINAIEDETFKFNSKAAMEARQTAVLLLEWAKNQDNLSRIKQFLQQLQEKLEDCLKFLTPGSINRDRLLALIFCASFVRSVYNGMEGFSFNSKSQPDTYSLSTSHQHNIP